MQKRKYEYIYILIIFSSFCSATLPGNFHSLLQSFYSVLTQLFSMVGHSIYPSAVIAQTILNNTRHLTLSLSRHPFLSLSLSLSSLVRLTFSITFTLSFSLSILHSSFLRFDLLYFFFHFFFLGSRSTRKKIRAHTRARLLLPDVRSSFVISFFSFFFLSLFFSFYLLGNDLLRPDNLVIRAQPQAKSLRFPRSIAGTTMAQATTHTEQHARFLFTRLHRFIARRFNETAPVLPRTN